MGGGVLIYIFTVGNMGVMICLGQGGLLFLSASSLFFFHLSVSSFVLQCGGSHALDCLNSIYVSLYSTFCQ